MYGIMGREMRLLKRARKREPTYQGERKRETKGYRLPNVEAEKMISI